MKQFGSSKTFSFLKGSMGRFNDFLSRCEEDVIVLAHTHTWKEDEIKGTKNGDSMYVNTGTWIDFAHDVSTLTPFLCSLDRKKDFSLCLICAALPSPNRERGTSAGSFAQQWLLLWPYFSSLKLIKYNTQRLWAPDRRLSTSQGGSRSSTYMHVYSRQRHKSEATSEFWFRVVSNRNYHFGSG